MPVLSGLPAAASALVFALSAALVWVAGARLARHGDALAERWHLGREVIGLVFLATVTELPEIVTTVTAARVDNPALVLGNMFGGITLQTAILAVADFFAVRHALTSWPRKPTQALVGALLVVLLSLLLAVTLTGDVALPMGIGLGALMLSASYPLVMLLLRRFDEQDSWLPVDLPDEADGHDSRPGGAPRAADRSTRQLVRAALVDALAILAAGMALALSADALAAATGLGASFVGVTLLAAATSLPELSTTLAAVRLGAYTMAIANIFGSNLIMLALILPADIAWRGGPILSAADDGARFSLATGIAVTGIYVAGILIRHTPRLFGAGLDSWLVAGIYLGSLAVLYHIA